MPRHTHTAFSDDAWLDAFGKADYAATMTPRMPQAHAGRFGKFARERVPESARETLRIVCHVSALVRAFAQGLYAVPDGEMPPPCAGVTWRGTTGAPALDALLVQTACAAAKLAPEAPLQMLFLPVQTVGEFHPQANSYVFGREAALAGVCMLLVIGVPPGDKFPIAPYRSWLPAPAPDMEWLTFDEYLLWVLTHEFRHIARYLDRNYESSQAVEDECNRAGIQAVRVWRRFIQNVQATGQADAGAALGLPMN